MMRALHRFLDPFGYLLVTAAILVVGPERVGCFLAACLYDSRVFAALEPIMNIAFVVGCIAAALMLLFPVAVFVVTGIEELQAKRARSAVPRLPPTSPYRTLAAPSDGEPRA